MVAPERLPEAGLNPLVNRSGSRSIGLARSLPVYYFTKVANVGDQLNRWLIPRHFGVDVVLTSPDAGPHLLAIGSLMSSANQHSQIWGTGLISATAAVGDIRPEKVHAVRGKLTHAKLRENGIPLRDLPLGDPAFLVAQSLGGATPGRRFRAGIAAHYVDRGSPWVREALRNADFIDLDVHLPVSEFIARLNACEAVISSSLHGLILAEAFSIPNVWVEISDKIVGAGFKFRDWFSLAGQPQLEPERALEGAEAICRRATLHDIRIDRDALTSAFPGALLMT
jgi:pyruvyltransferase